jgi:hypothetical protein
MHTLRGCVRRWRGMERFCVRLERLFQPGTADLPGEFPRLRTEMAVVGSLLGQLVSFSGDEQEEFALTRLLDDEPLTADNVQKAMR